MNVEDLIFRNGTALYGNKYLFDQKSTLNKYVL